MKEKVVITGITAITPLGNSLDCIYENLIKGISKLDYIKRYDVSGFNVRHGGVIDESILDTIEYPKDGNIQFKLFYYSLKKLLSNYDNYYNSERVGCIIGADPNTGAIEDYNILLNKNINTDIEEYVLNVNPTSLFYYASKDFNIEGPCFCNLGTCAASTQAIGDSVRLLRNKEVDMMITGGISSKLDPISLARLCRLGALEESKENIKENCSPFDKNRSGFTIGEGAILFTLEREADALKRNATIYAEVKGYGAALDGYSITDPDEEGKGMSLSMERALEDAGLKYTEVDYLNAHGTSTVKNDKCETIAIKNSFGEYSGKLDISSTKSMHGHLMTAAGAMETLVSILAINNNFIPPTINYKESDPECDLNYNANKGKFKEVNNVLTNSFGLGGQNSSLVISRYSK